MQRSKNRALGFTALLIGYVFSQIEVYLIRQNGKMIKQTHPRESHAIFKIQ